MKFIINKNSKHVTDSILSKDNTLYLSQLDDFFSSDDLIFFDRLKFIFDSQNKLNSIINPISPVKDFFYFDINDEIYFFDDFLEACENFKNFHDIKLNIESLDFFRKKGYYNAGISPVKNIKRLIPGHKYIITKNGLELIGLNPYKCFDENTKFEEKISNILTKKLSNYKKIGVLLSGGVDSTLIVVLLKKLNINFEVYTLNYSPSLDIVDNDRAGALKTCDELSIKCNVINVDIECDINTNFNEYFVNYPLGANLPSGFNAISNAAYKDNCDVLVSGQNLDNLYNLGFTSKCDFSRAGVLDLIRRFLLSDKVVKSVIEPYDSIIGFTFYRPIAWLISILYSLKKKDLYILPNTYNNLIDSFNSSQDGLIFSKHKDMSNFNNIYNSDNYYNYLLVEKVRTYMFSADSQSLIAVASKHNIDVLFPYSNDYLFNIWLSNRLKIQEIFKPKKLINNLLKDLYSGYFLRKSHVSESKKPHEWAKLINVFINKKFNNNSKYSKNITGMQSLQSSLSDFWINSLREYIKFGDNNEK